MADWRGEMETFKHRSNSRGAYPKPASPTLLPGRGGGLKALPSLCVALSIACFNSERSAGGDDRKGLAKAPRLVLNDGDRAFQYNGGTCGRGACVDKQDQPPDMSRCPLSAANTHHLTQSSESGLVPKLNGCGAINRLQVLPHMGFQPFRPLEKRAKRQSDLTMLISFRAGRKRSGIAQDVAPVTGSSDTRHFRIAGQYCSFPRLPREPGC